MRFRFAFPLILIFLVSTNVYSQDTRAQESRKVRLEKEIAIIDKQMKENATQSRSALASLTMIRQKISDRKELVAESEKEIKALEGKITAKQNEVSIIQNKLDTLTNYYSRLVKVAYKNRDSRLWYMYIFASDNIGQAFRRARYLKSISEEMNRQGEAITETREKLEKEVASLEKLKSEAERLKSQRTGEVALLEKEEKQSSELVSELQKNRIKYQKEMAAKKRQVDALNREIERIIAASVKGSPSGKASGSKTVVDTRLDAEFAKNKGRLPWPVEGPVVDHFGQHYHPVFKSVKLPFNNGVSIATEKDAAVKAIFDGIVKQIVVMPGYNKCVLVQHGNYFSFYCKLGSTSVKAGDKVKIGDILGTVDTIDGMTQLHFQIWKGTTPQNPESWLK